MGLSICEAAAKEYQGKIVQVHCNNSGGQHNYSDYSVNYTSYYEGKLLWGEGDVIAIETMFADNYGVEKPKLVLLNGWLICFVTLKEDLNPSHLIKSYHGSKVAQK